MLESSVSLVEEKSGGSLEIVKNGVEGYFKRKVILRNFETYDILQRFLSPWYFMEVLSCASETVNNVWTTIWVGVVSELWKHKNNIIFNRGVGDASEVFSWYK